MGRLRLSRVIRARLGYFAGVLLVAVGVALVAGIGSGLVAAGLLTVTAFVWLYDVTEPEKPVPMSVRGGDW